MKRSENHLTHHHELFLSDQLYQPLTEFSLFSMDMFMHVFFLVGRLLFPAFPYCTFSLVNAQRLSTVKISFGFCFMQMFQNKTF